MTVATPKLAVALALASAKYALFGPFWVGLVMAPDAVFARAGLRIAQ